MMPLAPTPILPVPTKPKIGFSIESLVGKDSSQANSSLVVNSLTSIPVRGGAEGGGGGVSSNSSSSSSSTSAIHNISRPNSSSALDSSSSRTSSPSPNPSCRTSKDDKRARSLSPLSSPPPPHHHHHHHHHQQQQHPSHHHPHHAHHPALPHHHHHPHHRRNDHPETLSQSRHNTISTTSAATNSNNNISNTDLQTTSASTSPSPNSPPSHGGGGHATRGCDSPDSPPTSVPMSVASAAAAHHHLAAAAAAAAAASLHAPGVSMAHNPFMDTLSSLKGIYAPEPTYTNGLMPGLVAPQPISCAPMAHIPQHPGVPNLSPLFLGNIGTVGHHQLHREAYPLYPWLLSRQGRFLGHRFQGPDAPAFLLQPFRKPKRIRTAFSPSQLLKLEHAFEKNHYVVGAERKHLAQTLSLTETQVKVWFQNRRTKHKRLKQEEEQSQSSPPSPKKKGTHHLNKWKLETNQSGEENSSEAP